RSVGEFIGSNEEAVRKRVSRALDKLQLLLKNRGVAFSASGLAAALSAQAVTAAPAGLAISISGAALANAATTGTTAFTVLKIMSMTKLKVGIASALIAAGIAIPLILQHQAQTKLQAENEALRRKAAQSDQLAAENEHRAQLAVQSSDTPPPSDSSRELLKLRGEVGKLRQENANVTAASKPTGESVLTGMTTDPKMKKLIHDQQKMGMGMMYGAFAKDAKLSKELTEKFNDLLADNVMENIDHITSVLRDGKSPAERDELFAQQDASVLKKVESLLGTEGVAKYEEFTRDLASHLTSEQFKGMLSGESADKDEKTKQIYQAMQAETKAALASAGLDPNFQTVPILNFRNIASESEAEKNLKLLEGIYENVSAQSTAFLTPEEVKKFREFQALAINNNRMGLVMNRKMMAPGAK
ncbi:MAG: hypothetical protein ABIQ35_03800, partial [Verrucomicrobiota bacterium]